ncbi:MAG: hypothetical protein KDA20_12125 [Phycisphaerales bacterium]|nr:hypothetical protein [Phycisphaerales bacterium]
MKTHRQRGGAPARAWGRTAIWMLAGGLLGGSLALLGGCATYANYPAIERDLAVNDPNIHPIPGLMRRALVRVLGDDRLHGRMPERWALNLPKGTGYAMAERVLAETMEQAGVTGGELVSVENDTLPIYSVTRVWIRGDQGEVDVVRPVAWVGLDDRPWSLQKITLHLRGGRYKWDVVTARAWPVGTAAEPELYGWPVVETAQVDEQGERLPEAFTQEAPAEPVESTAAYVEPVERMEAAEAAPIEPMMTEPAPPVEWHPIPQSSWR